MTKSATGLHAVLFFPTWIVMMVAMMFPVTAPMFLAVHKAQSARYRPDDAFAFTWIFVAAYLLVWTLAGVVAYAGEVVAGAVRYSLGAPTAAQLGGVVILLAGVYQLTPIKELCLRECRVPIATTTWHSEKTDILRMGLLHGLYCVGCYWLLFVTLYPLGMSIGAMAVITLIVLAEKALPWPTPVRHITAVALVLYGAMVAVGSGAFTSSMG
jgi:predicted metal-binding membrane protein